MTRNQRPHQRLLAASLLCLVAASALAGGPGFWKGWFQTTSKPTANDASKVTTSQASTSTFSSDTAINRLIQQYQVPVTQPTASTPPERPTSPAASDNASTQQQRTSTLQPPSTTIPPHRRDATPPSTSTIQTPTSGFLPPPTVPKHPKQRTTSQPAGDGPFVAWH